MQINSESQNPVTLYIKGNAKNIGSVGITYQNVYQAWLVIFSSLCRSKYSQNSAIIVTKGNAPINPPSLSFLFATSDIITTTSAVVRYLVIIQDKAAPYYFSRTLNNFIKIRPINH